MRIYVDSSALAKLLIEESGTDDMLQIWRGTDEVVCINVGYVEVRAAIAHRLPLRAKPRARRRLDEYWQTIETVMIDDELVDAAGEIADMHGLRALDALHLAAVQRIGDTVTVVATWDEELGRAARDAGFATAPW